MKNTIAAVFAFFSLGLAGCAGGPSATQYYADEELRMEMESYHYQTTYNQDSNVFIFDQKNVGARFRVYFDKQYTFGLYLANKTESPIVINWNGIEYIDVGGYAHSMIHEGVKFLEPVSAQRPTIIREQHGISDLLRPADRKPLDGAMRFARPSTPAAGDGGDGVTIVIPMKVLGQWVRHRYNIQIGMVAPTAPPYYPWD